MNTRIMNLQKTDRMLLLAIFLMLFTFHFSLPASFAQGLPLIRNFTATEYGGHNRNLDIEIGEDGTVFVANFEGRLLYYDRAQWRMIPTPDSCHITVLYRDSKNTIWVGGHHYFARLQNRPNGELFLQQVGGGLFKGGVMEIFEKDGSLQFLVKEGHVFEVKGGEDHTLPTISQKKQTDIRLNSSVEAEIVSQVALMNSADKADLNEITQTENLDGGLKVKVKRNHGLIIADDQGHDLYTITEANGLCSNQVSRIIYDGHGVLWGTTLHGIFAIELPSVYSYLLPKDGLTGEVHAITAFDDRIYVGSTNGLYVVSSRRCELLPGMNNICWLLSEYRDGLLAATSSGIYKIARGGQISRLTSNAATDMLVDGDKVYAGEPDGVWLYQSDFQLRTKYNDLPLVTDIRQDERGGLWFKNVHGETGGTGEGAPPQFESQMVSGDLPLAQLPQHLFMPISKIEVTAQYRHGDQIWIGGDEVLAIIDTSRKELTKLTTSRSIRFCSIILDTDSILWGGYGDMPKTLPKLGSDNSHLHFFYALDYAPLTGKTMYRYRLNDGRWSAWTEKQDVEFQNLFYGPYTLSVQAQLANGELSDVATIGFSIAYPLLMRWYMVVLYLLIFAYLLYLLFRYRLKRLEKEKIKLERIVEERTADLRNAQHELIRQEKMATVGKLTEGLIDRILNPMNFIIYFSKMSNDLLKDLKENFDHNKDHIDKDDYEDSMDVFNSLAEVQQNLDKYGQNTTRILKAMEEMLKDRTGGYVDMDLQNVLHQSQEMLAQNFAKEIEQYHIQTVFSLPSEAILLHGNPDMLSKTIMNLLGNAIFAVVKKSQKAPYDPEVSLSATVAEGRCVLKIRDNGIGIDEKIIGKVFDPFFTTKTTDEAAGVGLYLSREIIQNHKGDISVASVKNDYTEFTIHLPILQTT